MSKLCKSIKKMDFTNIKFLFDKQNRQIIVKHVFSGGCCNVHNLLNHNHAYTCSNHNDNTLPEI